MASNCEFHDTDKEIKAVIIQNCKSKRLRRYALREDVLTLENLLTKARSLEASEKQATGMEKSLFHTSEVNRVHHNKESKREQDPNKHDQVRVVSVDLRGLTRQAHAHVLSKENPAENVGSQTILQKCVSLSPVPDHVSTGAAKMQILIKSQRHKNSPQVVAMTNICTQ